MPEEVNRVVSDRGARRRPVLDSLGLDLGGYVLVTLHRPANVDDTATLAGLVAALGAIAVHRPVIFPVHPRTRSAWPAWLCHTASASWTPSATWTSSPWRRALRWC